MKTGEKEKKETIKKKSIGKAIKIFFGFKAQNGNFINILSTR